MRQRPVWAKVIPIIALGLIGSLAIAVVHADDPESREPITLAVEIREPEPNLIEFRLVADGLSVAQRTPHERFVRIHDGWLHYWLYTSPIDLRPGLRARVAGRLVDRAFLSVSPTASLSGSVGIKVFGTGFDAVGGVSVSIPALSWEPTGRLITTGIQLSYDGATWTEIIPLEREYYFDDTQPCLTDFPGLGTVLTLVEDAGFEVEPDDFCLGHGLQSISWMTTADVSIPSALRMRTEAGQPSIVSVSAGNLHTCATNSNGTVQCWGSNSWGMLNGPTSGRFTGVSAGELHTCALSTDGSIVCWGHRLHNKLARPLGHQFTQISAGAYHTCALDITGTATCWGYNDKGQTDAPRDTFRQVSAGYKHTCAVTSDGSIRCWGDDATGQATPPQFAQYLQVSAGNSHTCALSVDGSIQCWGANERGQTTAPTGNLFTQISAGGGFSCAHEVGGAVACWGGNWDDRATPPADDHFTHISAGQGHGCATTADGGLRCWGLNDNGQTNVPEALRQPSGALIP